LLWLGIPRGENEQIKEHLCMLVGICNHYGKQYGSFLKKLQIVGCWWLTPIILATQEADLRRIVAQSQPRQIVCEILS
jgi:hypothetical protein